MEEITKFIKLPQVKAFTWLLTGAVVFFAGLKLYGTIVNAQIAKQQKEINKYIIDEKKQAKAKA